MKHKYLIIVLIGFTFWIGESWYFGWNRTAETTAEAWMDSISTILIFWGIIGDILQGMTIVKNTNITTRNVKIEKPNINMGGKDEAK
jgi:hypothetical protein